MRVVFFGTPEFAVPSLLALLQHDIEVAAAVTQPDRPRGRSHSTLLPPPVKVAAETAGVAVLQPERPRDAAFYDQLRACNADIGVVVAYGHLLRPELLAIPRLGCINVHASLLPRWRGAAPIHWSLLSGDGETGVSIMRIEAGLDTGAVWHMRETPILATDTTGSLFERLSHLGADALMQALPRIIDGAPPIAQDEARATHAPKIGRDDARIRWDAPAPAVSCRIRAMDPAPGAWTTFDALDVKIRGGAIASSSETHAEPGTLAARGDDLLVSTETGNVVITGVQPAGKRMLPALEWWRGVNQPAAARFI